jgi:sulfite reductase (NADPH) hemoprotein beta-component
MCIPHKKTGYAIVTVSMKETGVARRVISQSGQLEYLADLAEQYSFGEVRVTPLSECLCWADVPQKRPASTLASA